MSKFDKHFKMTEADAIDYIREKLPAYFGAAELTCKEIGDGNINYVFRVKTVDGSKSIIIKHADEYVRSSGNRSSTDRNRIEAEILKLERQMSPEHVPEIYLYDPVMCCVVMQDIGDHENLRYALIAHKTFPRLAADMAVFCARTLIGTTDLVLSRAEKKVKTGTFINPAMCDISERLVFQNPYTDAQHTNKLFEGNEQFLTQELYEDEALKLEAAKLKYEFQTKAQSLVHGDLHSGSIFVRSDSTMVLDPEFAYYGPAGYDTGNVIAHLVFAWANAEATISDEAEKQAFQTWVENAIEEFVDRFSAEARQLLKQSCTDPLFADSTFIDWYVDGILSDTAGYAGTELIRRIIGSAKVKDITGIADANARIEAERICVLAAKAYIMNRKTMFRSGKDYVEQLHNALKKVSELQ